MSTNEKVRFLIFRTTGNFMLLLALYGVYAAFSPVISQELRVRVEKAKGVSYAVAKDDDLSSIKQPKLPVGQPGALDALLSNKKEYILIPKDPLFSILIPKIGASEKIIANVDPGDEKVIEQALSSGVAHAKGTVFPGMPGNTYLFAHSAEAWWNAGRQNPVFYLIKDLEVGDEIVIFFENRRYNYLVQGKYIADPKEVSLLENSKGNTQQLILQTCWPPGTAWKRLFIIAQPANSESPKS